MKSQTIEELPIKFLYALPLLMAAIGLAIVASFGEMYFLIFFAVLVFLVAVIHPQIRLLSLILLMPFVYSGLGFALSGFGLFDLYAVFFISIFILHQCRGGWRFERVPVLGGAGIMALAFIPSLLNTASLETSLNSFLRFLYPLVLAWALYDAVWRQRNPRLLRLILLIFVIETFFIALYGIYDSYAQRSLVNAFVGRVQFGLFPEVNYYAAYLTLAFPLAYSLLLVEKGRLAKIIFLVILGGLFFSVVLTVSRSAMATLVLIFLLYGAYMFKKLAGVKKLFSIALIVALLAGVGLTVFTETGRKTVDVIALVHRVQSALSGRDVSFKQRLTILEVATRMVSAHPVAGVGFGAFERSFNDYQSGNFSTASARSTHNTPLRMLAETGVIGLSAGIIFIINFFIFLWQTNHYNMSPYWRAIWFGLNITLLSFLLLGLALDALTEPPFWVVTALTLATGAFAREGLLASP